MIANILFSQHDIRWSSILNLYLMSLLDSGSTSVLYEPYHADDGEAATELIGPQKKNLSQSSTQPSSTAVLSCYRSWLPELFASLLSMLPFIPLVYIPRNYHDRAPNDIDLLYPVCSVLTDLSLYC